mgnify:CR=1 FL=1
MSEETMTPEQGSGELTVNEAAAAFEGFLSAGEDSNEQPETVEAEAEDTVEDEVDESGEDEVVADESMEAQDEGDEEAEVDEEELEEETRYVVKAAGEEKEVTLDELMQGYQLGADYTKKTQEVAEQRKAIEAEAAAGDEKCQVALNMAAYRIKQYLGSYAAILNGLDAIIFTAGIGENSDVIRKMVCENLDFLGIQLDEEKNDTRASEILEVQAPTSKVKVLIIPTDEEVEIAKQSFELIN